MIYFNLQNSWINKQLEDDIQKVMAVVKCIRTVNSPYSHHIHATKKSPAITIVIDSKASTEAPLYIANQQLIAVRRVFDFVNRFQLLSFCPQVTILENAAAPACCAMQILNPAITVYSDLKV